VAAGVSMPLMPGSMMSRMTRSMFSSWSRTERASSPLAAMTTSKPSRRSMTSRTFLDAGGVNGERDRALHGGFFQVVTPRTPLRGSTEIRHAGKTYCQQTHERR